MDEQHEEFARNLRKHIMELEIAPSTNAILSGHVGTLDVRSDILFDSIDIEVSMSQRDDIGFVVIERTPVGELIVRYMFSDFADFSRQVVKLPLN